MKYKNKTVIVKMSTVYFIRDGADLIHQIFYCLEERVANISVTTRVEFTEYCEVLEYSRHEFNDSIIYSTEIFMPTPILKVFNSSSNEWTPNLNILSEVDSAFLEVLNETQSLIYHVSEQATNIPQDTLGSGFFSFITNPVEFFANGLSKLIGTIPTMILGFTIEWIVLPVIIILGKIYFLKYLILKFVFNCKSS